MINLHLIHATQYVDMHNVLFWSKLICTHTVYDNTTKRKNYLVTEVLLESVCIYVKYNHGYLLIYLTKNPPSSEWYLPIFITVAVYRICWNGTTVIPYSSDGWYFLVVTLVYFCLNQTTNKLKIIFYVGGTFAGTRHMFTTYQC